MSQFALHWFALAIDASFKILVLAAAVAAGLWMLRIRNSSARHIAWLSVLLAMLALPVLTGVLPGLRLPVPGVLSVVALERTETEVPNAEQASFDARPSTVRHESNRPLPVRGKTNVAVPPDAASADQSAPFDMATDGATVSGPSPGKYRERRPGNPATAEVKVDRNQRSARPLAVLNAARDSWPLILASAWLLAALALVCRQMLALIVTWRLVRRSVPISVLSGPDRAAGGVRGSLSIRESSDIRIPLTAGTVRPVVLLPADWRTWSAEKLSHVLRHEQTHAERRDCLTRLLGELALCVYWFHPLAWWLRRKLAALAEDVCDDAVIDATHDRTAYARHILEFAALLSTGSRHVVYAGLSMARHSNVESRINAILDLSRPLSRRLTWTTTIVILAVIVPLAGVAAALRPSVVAPATSQSSTSSRLAEAAAFLSNALALGPGSDAAGPTAKPFKPTRIKTFAVPGQVGSFAFDSTGKKLVTVGWSSAKKDSMQSWIDGTNPGDIRIWDLASGNVVTQFGDNVGGIFDVAVSPDGKTIVTAGRVLNSPNRGAVVIWDLKTQKPIRTLEGQPSNAQAPPAKNQAWSLSVAYSPDGKLIAAGGFDRRVKVWEAASGKQVTVLRYFKMLPRSVSFSADGKTLVTGYEAGSAVLWDVGTWTRRSVFNAKDVILMSADLSHDGKHLVAGGPEKVTSAMGQGGRIHFWDVASGREEAPIRTETSASGIAFSPDGRHFAAAAYRSKIWATAGGEEIAEFQRAGSSSGDKLRFSPDGNALAIAGQSGVTLWDVGGLNSNLTSRDKPKRATDRTETSSPAAAAPTHWTPRPKARKRFAYDPDARLRVVDDEGRGIPQFDVKIRTANRGRSQWFHGSKGEATLEFMLGFGDATTFDLVVRATGEYASTSVHFSGAKSEQLLDGKATIVLHRGEPVQLQFHLPPGMIWPPDVKPEVYFDDDSDFARAGSQPVNRRNGFEEPNALGLRPAGPASFTFRLSRESAPFDVGIYSPGFLRSFERGPFTFADFKQGVLEIPVEQPAVLDVHFDAGGHKAEDLPFAGSQINVYRKRPGSNAITQVAGQDSGPPPQELRLADLAAGEYAVMLRTKPKASESPRKRFDPFAPNPAIFRDYKEVTLGTGQTKQVDLHYVPFDEHLYQGDRTAVVEITKPDGKPAAGREVAIGYADPHYGQIPVFSGPVPPSGAITLKNVTAKKAEGLRAGPYLVRLGFEQLGNFGFKTKDSVETFKFLVPPNAGDEAPEVELINVSTGKPTHVSDFRGRVVWLEFWATWCGPCQEPMRLLDELAAQHRASWKGRVAIVAVSIDNKAEQAKRHLTERGWTHVDPYWAGPVEGNGFDAAAARAFVVSGVPTAFLIGPDGRILWRGHPLAAVRGKSLADRIDEALEPHATGKHPPVPHATVPNERTENKATNGDRAAAKPIRGRVVNHQGQPCSEAEVLLLGDERIVVEGDKRTWFVLGRGNEGKSIHSTTTTDEKGRFQISPGEERPDRIAVISSDVLLWEIPLKAVTTPDDVLIKLPAPGSLLVDFNLPHKPRENELSINLRKFAGSDQEPDLLRFMREGAAVANPGQKVFDHLPPARYSVERWENTPLGGATLITPCEQTSVSVESGKQSRVRFQHDVGRAIEGHVKGLENVPIRSAHITIDYWGPQEAGSQTLTHFDVIPIKSDGRFVTDRLPPRKYDLQLYAIRASTPDGSVSPDFVGTTSVTVMDQGPVAPVEIEATPPGGKFQKQGPTAYSPSQERETLAALRNLGAQLRVNSGESAHGIELSDLHQHINVIVLGKNWKGGDGDLQKLSGLPSLETVFVVGKGRVSDKALAELRKAWPDLKVERISEAVFGVAAHAWKEKGGLHIDKVWRNTPADRIGMRAGDVMLQFAGKPVPDYEAFRALMFPLRPGQKVDVKLLRGEKAFTVNVELSEWN